MHASLRRKILRALDEADLVIQRTATLNGRPVMGYWEPPDRIVLAAGACRNADELVLTLLHEALHMVALPEHIVAEGLERVVFASPAVRYAAARLLLDRLLEVHYK